MYHFRFATVLISLSVSIISSRANSSDVIVALHEETTTVSGQTIRVGDIARVFGGAASDRRNIEQLDLESLRDQKTCSITRKQIQMRLLLAGYQRQSFEVTGPTAISCQRSSPAQLRDSLEKMLASEIGRQFGVGPDRIQIRLTNETQLSEAEKRLGSTDFSIELLPRNDFPIGQTRLSVNLIDSSGLRNAQSLDAQVSVSMNVAIAAEPISRGTVIKSDMVRFVQRAITAKSDYANTEEIVGRTASRYISSNSIVLANQLIVPRRGTNETVKRNDLIDVVIRIGRGEIRLKNARAMESGTVGETIEVLNPQSNRRINASIVGPNLATLSPTTRRQ